MKTATKFEFLRYFKEKAKNPNAIKLLKEIEHLYSIGSQERGNALLSRYKERYANNVEKIAFHCASAIVLDNKAWSVVASIYKEARKDSKRILDDLPKIQKSKNFHDYVLNGGVLKIDIDYNRVKLELKRLK